MSYTRDVDLGEKTAAAQIYEVSPTLESASTRSQPSPSTSKVQGTSRKNGNDTLKNVNHATENDDDNKWRNWIVNTIIALWHNFSWWWLGAVTLAIPLVLTATVFRTAHIKNVRLFGFFFWLAISWCGLLVSYISSWTLGYIWFVICQNSPIPDNYETFVVDIRHSVMFFLWAIISWALVPLLCVLGHHHCTDHWVFIFHKALLATFIFAFIFLVKSFFVQQLFIKATMEKSMKRRQRELQRWFYAIVILLPIFDERCSIFELVNVMRRWSRSKSTNKSNRKQADPPLSTAVIAQHVTDILRGNGNNDAYSALRSAIEHTALFRALHDPHRDSITHVPRDGLYKAHVDSYLKYQLEEKKRHWHIWNKDFSLALSQFTAIDDLWPILQDSKLDNEHDTDFVSFDDLDWLILQLGEGLKEVAQSQKNLKRVITSLNVRLTLFLCIPVAIIYVAIFTRNFATNFAPLWTAFFGVSFAIQDPVKEFVSACIFVFAQHPYDKGDLLVLEEQKDLTLAVIDIYLMHTSFEPVEGGVYVHVPHSKLRDDCIENLSRFEEFQAPTPVVLHLDTQKPLPNDSDMRELQEDITKYVQDNPNRFYRIPTLTLIPIKEEELVESGIQVNFRPKRFPKIPQKSYKWNKAFRNEVVRFLRGRLRDRGFHGPVIKEATSEPDQDTKQGITAYGGKS